MNANYFTVLWDYKMEIHKDELIALWNISQNDGEIFKIEPLK